MLFVPILIAGGAFFEAIFLLLISQHLVLVVENAIDG